MKHEIRSASILSHQTSKRITNYRAQVTVEFNFSTHEEKCERCSAIAPPPTEAQLVNAPSIQWLEEIVMGRYVYAIGREEHHPLDEDWDRREGKYIPAGWVSIDGKVLCGPCGGIVRAALDAALKGPDRPEAP